MVKAADYYILAGDAVRGPTTAGRIRELAAKRKISQDALVKRGAESQEWFRAADLPGLFDGKPAGADGELIRDPFAGLLQDTLAAFGGAFGKIKNNARAALARRAERKAEKMAVAAAVKSLPPPPAPARTQPTTFVPAVQNEVACPFCAETIKREAKKCRHCGEILDPALRELERQRGTVVQHDGRPQIIRVEAPRIPKWNGGVAAVLSFFIPGLGQLYKGQVINALCWFFLVPIGYILFLLPGLALHFLCVVGATMGDPYR